ncbi:uncharacterized protein MELLADRAFT_85153 [Melampsora larici-populina 98AG31]|uniref:Major facilitator superfamily (MFS) profile domain-containing protein n=1 Tax=Melampsora larici-populina (strain 98AG31 / pathotype 3-4-7) TaxID=747676 RepID=F4RHP8_MELLP|nr:uncharacterized protein MELLADRAFT_85153 [Melampsora larici-populina 98AG31]EGG07860.1 hypothetical protein MELLADRAFT_85153 [Melampsora larici-populina 98AG31]
MNKSLAAFIGTLCSGILYCFGAVLTPLMDKYPWIIKWGPTLGTITCSASCLIAGYSSKPWQLVLSQGFLYGFGGGDFISIITDNAIRNRKLTQPCFLWSDDHVPIVALLYYPAFVFLAEWWVDRRGLAGGIMFSGASVFGLLYPPVLEWSLKNYGTAITYRAFAVFWLIIVLPMMPFFHGRLPMAHRRNPQKSSMTRYLKTPLFWAFMLVTLIQSLAFFVPSLYMPAYATIKGLPGGLILALYSGACIFGQLLVGTVSDHFDSSWLIGITSICSGISILGLWGHCNGFAMLASFALILDGLSAGGFSCLWQRFAMRVAPSEQKSSNLISFFAISRGIANVLTGPIAGALVQNSSSAVEGYQTLVNYSGTLMLLSSIGVGIRLLYTTKNVS